MLFYMVTVMSLNEQSLIKLAQLIQTDEYFYSYVGGDFEYLAGAFKKVGIEPADLDSHPDNIKNTLQIIISNIDVSNLGGGFSLNTAEVALWHKRAIIKMILHFQGFKGEYDNHVPVDQLRKELNYLTIAIAQDQSIPIEKVKLMNKIVSVISNREFSKNLTDAEFRSFLDLTKMLISNLKKSEQEINSILTAWELKNKSNWETHYSSHTLSLFVAHNTLIFLFNWIKSLFVSPDFKPIETQIPPQLKSFFLDEDGGKDYQLGV